MDQQNNHSTCRGFREFLRYYLLREKYVGLFQFVRFCSLKSKYQKDYMLVQKIQILLIPKHFSLPQYCTGLSQDSKLNRSWLNFRLQRNHFQRSKFKWNIERKRTFDYKVGI